MISEQELLELVVALNAYSGRAGGSPNNLTEVTSNYAITLDKNGNLAGNGISALSDGVGIVRDTEDVWSLTIRPAARFGKPMRYRNPVDLVRAALARAHGENAFFLNTGEVRRLRSNRTAKN